eukprot:scaffold9642_cov84-Skeletonema_dohrnii-CCMP3373.AAC.2
MKASGRRPVPTTPWDAVWNGVAEWAGSDDLSKVCPQKSSFDETEMFDAASMFRPPGPTMQPSTSKSPTDAPVTPPPSNSPTAMPTPEPTAAVTSSPTPEPTAAVTASPTPEPTAAVTSSPTPEPTAAVTASPTPEPTAAVTSSTPVPTEAVTASPTAQPTEAVTTPTQPVSVNLALEGAATQSTTCYTGYASRAIDGNTDGDWSNKSVTHTCSGVNWWMVDLGADKQHTITSVKIYNRSDCCNNRLTDMDVQVLDQSDNVVAFQTIAADDVQLQYNFDFGGVQGRYVRLKRNVSGQFNMAEVEVMGFSSTGL